LIQASAVSFYVFTGGIGPKIHLLLATVYS
jgi:hypothetical protein